MFADCQARRHSASRRVEGRNYSTMSCTHVTLWRCDPNSPPTPGPPFRHAMAHQGTHKKVPPYEGCRCVPSHERCAHRHDWRRNVPYPSCLSCGRSETSPQTSLQPTCHTEIVGSGAFNRQQRHMPRSTYLAATADEPTGATAAAGVVCPWAGDVITAAAEDSAVASAL